MALEEPYKKLSDEELKAKTQEFKTRLAGGETLDDLLPRLSQPSARRQAGCSACARTACRSWAASCSIREELPK